MTSYASNIIYTIAFLIKTRIISLRKKNLPLILLISIKKLTKPIGILPEINIYFRSDEEFYGRPR